MSTPKKSLYNKKPRVVTQTQQQDDASQDYVQLLASPKTNTPAAMHPTTYLSTTQSTAPTTQTGMSRSDVGSYYDTAPFQSSLMSADNDTQSGAFHGMNYGDDDDDDYIINDDDGDDDNDHNMTTTTTTTTRANITTTQTPAKPAPSRPILTTQDDATSYLEQGYPDFDDEEPNFDDLAQQYDRDLQGPPDDDDDDYNPDDFIPDEYLDAAPVQPQNQQQQQQQQQQNNNQQQHQQENQQDNQQQQQQNQQQQQQQAKAPPTRKLALKSIEKRLPPEALHFVEQQRLLKEQHEFERKQRKMEAQRKLGGDFLGNDKRPRPVGLDGKTEEEQNQDLNNIDFSISDNMYHALTTSTRKTQEDYQKQFQKQRELLDRARIRRAMESADHDSSFAAIQKQAEEDVRREAYAKMTPEQRRVLELERQLSFHTRQPLLPKFGAQTLLQTHFPEPKRDTFHEALPASLRFRYAEELGDTIARAEGISADANEEEPFKEYLADGKVFSTYKPWQVTFFPVGEPQLEYLHGDQQKQQQNDDDEFNTNNTSDSDDMTTTTTTTTTTTKKHKAKKQNQKSQQKKKRLAAMRLKYKPVYLLQESHEQQALRLQTLQKIFASTGRTRLHDDGTVNDIYETLENNEKEFETNKRLHRQQRDQASEASLAKRGPGTLKEQKNKNANGPTPPAAAPQQKSIVKQLSQLSGKIKGLSIANRKTILSTILQRHQEGVEQGDDHDEFLDYIILLKEQHAKRLEHAVKLDLDQDSIQDIKLKQQIELELIMEIADAQQNHRDKRQKKLRQERRSMFMFSHDDNGDNQDYLGLDKKDGAVEDDDDDDDFEGQIDYNSLLNHLIETNPQYQVLLQDSSVLEYLQEEFNMKFHGYRGGQSDGGVGGAAKGTTDLTDPFANDYQVNDSDDETAANDATSFNLKDLVREDKEELARAKREAKQRKLLLKQGKKVISRDSMLFVDKYAPRGYAQLLSHERYNRDVLSWMTRWNNIVFHKPVPRPVQYKQAWQLRLEQERLKEEGQAETFDKNKTEEEKKKDGNVTFVGSSAQHDIITRFGPQHQKILLLAGPPGCGKTSLVNVLCDLLKYRRIEINASDDRSYEAVSQRITNALESNSIFDQPGQHAAAGTSVKPNCLVLEEIDGAMTSSSTGDSEGAATTVIEILVKLAQDAVQYDKDQIFKMFNDGEEGGADEDGLDENGNPKKKNAEDKKPGPNNNNNNNNNNNQKKNPSTDPKRNKGKQLTRPIIATCNFLQAACLKPLLPYCKIVELPTIDPDAILTRLNQVVQQEGILCDPNFLPGLVELLGTDIRSCLHVLQFSSYQATKKFHRQELLKYQQREEQRKALEELQPAAVKKNKIRKLPRVNILKAADLKKMRIGQHDSPTSVNDLVQLILTLQESQLVRTGGMVSLNGVAGSGAASRFNSYRTSIQYLRDKYGVMTVPKRVKAFFNTADTSEQRQELLQNKDLQAEAEIYNLLNNNIDTISTLITEYNSLDRIFEQIYYLHPIYTGYDPDMGRMAEVAEMVSYYNYTQQRPGGGNQANANILSESLSCLPLLLSYYVSRRVTSTGSGGPQRKNNRNQKEDENMSGVHIDPRLGVRQFYNNPIATITNRFNQYQFTYANNYNQLSTFVKHHYVKQLNQFITHKEALTNVLPFLYDMLITIPSISHLPTLCYSYENGMNCDVDELIECCEKRILESVKNDAKLMQPMHQKKKKDKFNMNDDSDSDSDEDETLATTQKHNNNKKKQQDLLLSSIKRTPGLLENDINVGQPRGDYKLAVINSCRQIVSTTWNDIKNTAHEAALIREHLIPLMAKLNLTYEQRLVRGAYKNQFGESRYTKQWEMVPNLTSIVYYDMSVHLKLYTAYELLLANDKQAYLQQHGSSHFRLIHSAYPSKRKILLTNVYDAAEQTAQEYNQQFQMQNQNLQWNRQDQPFFGFPPALKHALANETKVFIDMQQEYEHQQFVLRQKEQQQQRQLEQERQERQRLLDAAHANAAEDGGAELDRLLAELANDEYDAMGASDPTAAAEEKKMLELYHMQQQADEQAQREMQALQDQYDNIAQRTAGADKLQQEQQELKRELLKKQHELLLNGGDAIDLTDPTIALSKTAKLLNFRGLMSKAEPKQQEQQQAGQQQQSCALGLLGIPTSTSTASNGDDDVVMRSDVAASRAKHTLQLKYFDGFSDAVKKPVDMSFFLE